MRVAPLKSMDIYLALPFLNGLDIEIIIGAPPGLECASKVLR